MLNFSRWDAGAVRDDLRGYVLSNLGDPAGVVVADEAGFLKKGTWSTPIRDLRLLMPTVSVCEPQPIIRTRSGHSGQREL